MKLCLLVLLVSAGSAFAVAKIPPPPRHRSLRHTIPTLTTAATATATATTTAATTTPTATDSSFSTNSNFTFSDDIFSGFHTHMTALLETDSTQIPGVGGGGITMLICALLCQIPDNRECMVPCLKHIRCVGLMADPMKAVGMVELSSISQNISPHMREQLMKTTLESDVMDSLDLSGQSSVPEVPENRFDVSSSQQQQPLEPSTVVNYSNGKKGSESNVSKPIELGDDNLSDYIDEKGPETRLVTTTTALQEGSTRPVVPGIQSGLDSLKSGINAMGGFLPIALLLLFPLIMLILIKFLGFFLELFVKLRCFLGYYLPEYFMAGMCGWRCTGKALCIFRCLDSFACCDMFMCTTKTMKGMGFNPFANMGRIPGMLTDCSARDCHVSAFGCGKDGKHVPMFGETQVKLMKMMFGTDADIYDGLPMREVFPFWMFRLVSQELALGKGIEAIGSIGNDYDEHMKRVMYYMGQ
eukprot:c9502_g2_i2.p1 GENE.c9502_g2_i2~~c9502_g2_i2.p1  ORF type:complete len:470 (+),score=124.48 c9502_g2_i2:41-1450(+)